MSDRLTTNLADFRFKHPLRVRYSEVDAQGVVFYAHYATFADVGITEYLRAIGYDYVADARETGVDFHLVKTHFEYLAPAHVDEEIEVHIRVARIGSSSITFAAAVTSAGSPDLVMAGELVWVYTDQTTHRPVPVQDHLAAKIRDLEGASLAD